MFYYNVFFQSNLKSLKSSNFPFVIIFSSLFVFVTFTFTIFKDRVFTSLFIDSEDVYILDYKLYFCILIGHYTPLCK